MSDLLHLPDDLPILPLSGIVIYPQTVVPLAVGQPVSVRLVDAALSNTGFVGVVALRGEGNRPERVDAQHCYVVGTAAIVHRLLRLPDGTLRIAVEGVARIMIEQLREGGGELRAQVRLLSDEPGDQQVVASQTRAVLAQVAELAQRVPTFSEELQIELLAAESPQRLVYLLAANVLPHTSVAERQELLAINRLDTRLEHLHGLIARELERARRAPPPPTSLAQADVLERHGELLALPLVQQIVAAGREAGRLLGRQEALVALLRARFAASERREALVQRLAQVRDFAALDSLLVATANAQQLTEIEALLHTAAALQLERRDNE